MDIFITGGSGFVGRAAITRLVAAGHGVRAMSRTPGSDAAIRDLGAEPVRCDLDSVTADSVRGAEVVIHDPWVPEYRGALEERVQGCDAVVVMVAHSAYRDVDLAQLRMQVARPILIDGRHVFSAEHVQAAGWVYRCLGTGSRKAGRGARL